jgi:5,10-methylenetetrahydromethanopterin reductase
MQFGIAIPTAADSWRLVRRAEELGFSHAWFFDTQMLNADPFVAMTAAAMKTTRIKLGTGVLIPSNRIAPVAATAFASLNKLAPGRIVFGISTGFTGRRTMGLGAVRLADMEEYIRVVQALWRGETVEIELEGKRRPIRLLNPELGLINTHDPIPLFIAASGPRARKLTAKLGAGWIDNVADVERGVATLEQMRAAWQQAGRARDDLAAVAWLGGAVLDEGEPADGPRGMALAGPRAAMLLHRAADTALAGYPAPLAMLPEFADAVARYVEHARRFEPKDAYYLSNHRGHLMFVRPDERQYITAEMIRRTSFIGTEADLKQRVAALAEAGFRQAVFSIPPGQEHAIEDWGRIRRAFR